jgi:hypothetical protein
MGMTLVWLKISSVRTDLLLNSALLTGVPREVDDQTKELLSSAGSDSFVLYPRIYKNAK